MLRSAVIFVTLAFAVSGSHISLGNQIWRVPQLNGRTRWMTWRQAQNEAILTEPKVNDRRMDKVRFFLYTQVNPDKPIELEINNMEALVRSTFNKNHLTRFMIHGWNGGHISPQNVKILDAVFNNTDKSPKNLFLVDWSVYGETLNYISAQRSCSKAGKILAEFIDWLHDNGKLSFKNLILMGHSLGAHVVGFAGKNVQRGKIHTIIGLDPAMPLFSYSNPETRLSDTDAEYVETITTYGGMAGFYQPIGKAAFYPNGGRSQPGCGLDIDGECAHERAVDYYAEAMKLKDKNSFYSVGCSDFADVKSANCNVRTGGIRLGDPNNINRAEGVYYLETNGFSPFGKGNIYEEYIAMWLLVQSTLDLDDHAPHLFYDSCLVNMSSDVRTPAVTQNFNPTFLA